MKASRALLGLLALLLVFVAACGSDTPTPSPTDSPTASPGSELSSTPLPTPILQGPWVEARLEAYAEIYGITPEGREVLASLDVRHMMGQPAWFGSTGFNGFAGVGQSRVGTVAHELGHSYWGAFPVSGRTDLSWEIPFGDNVAPALAEYRDDLVRFMLQPPDRYEPLRERFRNLPNLSEGDVPDLVHIGEADMVSLVAGNLNLLPPILRKYFSRYLSPGQYQSWDDILGWYRALVPDDKRIADAYLGLAHIPKDVYQGLELQTETRVPDQIRDLILREERQRLIDFSQQFDLITGGDVSLVDAAGVDRGFPFWRGYLREMFDIYKRNPELLSNETASEKADEIMEAFTILADSEGMELNEQLEFLKDQLSINSFLYHFIPILKNRVLVRLLDAEEGVPPPTAFQKGTGAFVEEIRRFIAEVDRILEIAGADVEGGARALEAYLSTLKDQPKDKLGQDIDTIFEVFVDTDQDTTKEIMALVQDETIRELLNINPSRIRFLLEPERLLGALQIDVNTASEALVTGLNELFENSSGNFELDKPFTEEVYRRVSERGRQSPVEALSIISGVPKFPMPGFLFEHPTDSVFILSSDLEQALDLVKASEPVRVPPVRLVYHIIYVDPIFAARVVDGLDQRGETELVSESLIYFAYDFDRLQANPTIKTSLESDASFLTELLELKGQSWLSSRIGSSISRYTDKVGDGLVDPDFLDAYRRTLTAAIGLVKDEAKQAALAGAITTAFSQAVLDF